MVEKQEKNRKMYIPYTELNYDLTNHASVTLTIYKVTEFTFHSVL